MSKIAQISKVIVVIALILTPVLHGAEAVMPVSAKQLQSWLREAEAAARGIEDEFERIYALSLLAITHAGKGDMNKAKELLEILPQDDRPLRLAAPDLRQSHTLSHIRDIVQRPSQSWTAFLLEAREQGPGSRKMRCMEN